MTVTLTKKPDSKATPLLCATAATWPDLSKTLSAPERAWCKTVGFAAKPDTHVLLAAADGTLARVLVGVRAADDPYALSALPQALQAGRYALDPAGLAIDPEAAALVGVDTARAAGGERGQNLRQGEWLAYGDVGQFLQARPPGQAHPHQLGFEGVEVGGFGV